MLQIIPRYKIFPTKNVTNGDRLGYTKIFATENFAKILRLNGQIVFPAKILPRKKSGGGEVPYRFQSYSCNNILR